MPIYTLRLIDKQEVARNTHVFYFEKPAGFQFMPGQYGGFTLIAPTETDEKGITRRFSILSAPHDDHLAIATRIQTSAYKRVLAQLPIGAEMKFAGPTGNFILHEDRTLPAVMIAGGIGITLFYSMIRHSLTQTNPHTISLFYGNQCLQDAAFHDEFESIQNEHAHFNLHSALIDHDVHWKGHTGYISYELLKQSIPNLQQPIYYVCGSPAMVAALQETLDELGIAKENIRVEDFPGY